MSYCVGLPHKQSLLTWVAVAVKYAKHDQYGHQLEILQVTLRKKQISGTPVIAAIAVAALSLAVAAGWSVSVFHLLCLACYLAYNNISEDVRKGD